MLQVCSPCAQIICRKPAQFPQLTRAGINLSRSTTEGFASFRKSVKWAVMARKAAHYSISSLRDGQTRKTREHALYYADSFFSSARRVSTKRGLAIFARVRACSIMRLHLSSEDSY